MKKMVLAVIAVILMSAPVFSEFNLRTSLDIAGDYKIKTGRGNINAPGSENYDTSVSVTLSGEYIVPAIENYLKVGCGFELPVPRRYYRDDGYTFWHMPVYLSAQTNPVPRLPELFFRLNLGYNLLFLDTMHWDSSYISVNYKRGLYYSFSAGWEFPFGLFVDATYAVYNSGIEYKHLYFSQTADITYSRAGIGVGYKFKGHLNIPNINIIM